MSHIQCSHSSIRRYLVAGGRCAVTWCINCGCFDAGDGGGWSAPERPELGPTGDRLRRVGAAAGQGDVDRARTFLAVALPDAIHQTWAANAAHSSATLHLAVHSLAALLAQERARGDVQPLGVVALRARDADAAEARAELAEVQLRRAVGYVADVQRLEGEARAILDAYAKGRAS